ncbi:hypothetical protein [Marseilla massiliensis]|uniref:60S ribosomal protein L28 n=1 Tax=Marseilla massiliensis TaxID=1841864 RepID=A0A939B7I2_9BACT|nr:hypothetical protein [Marseilla massiliensis]MBM6673811.1 hypothetical protein [Marseilla massiliensis]
MFFNEITSTNTPNLYNIKHLQQIFFKIKASRQVTFCHSRNVRKNQATRKNGVPAAVIHAMKNSPENLKTRYQTIHSRTFAMRKDGLRCYRRPSSVAQKMAFYTPKGRIPHKKTGPTDAHKAAAEA